MALAAEERLEDEHQAKSMSDIIAGSLPKSLLNRMRLELQRSGLGAGLLRVQDFKLTEAEEAEMLRRQMDIDAAIEAAKFVSVRDHVTEFANTFGKNISKLGAQIRQDIDGLLDAGLQRNDAIIQKLEIYEAEMRGYNRNISEAQNAINQARSVDVIKNIWDHLSNQERNFTRTVSNYGQHRAQYAPTSGWSYRSHSNNNTSTAFASAGFGLDAYTPDRDDNRRADYGYGLDLGFGDEGGSTKKPTAEEKKKLKEAMKKLMAEMGTTANGNGTPSAKHTTKTTAPTAKPPAPSVG
ncbi:MAG: hypothetical protein ACRBCT_01995 [Alphaproteobacteria bacterium]